MSEEYQLKQASHGYIITGGVMLLPPTLMFLPDLYYQLTVIVSFHHMRLGQYLDLHFYSRTHCSQPSDQRIQGHHLLGLHPHISLRHSGSHCHLRLSSYTARVATY